MKKELYVVNLKKSIEVGELCVEKVIGFESEIEAKQDFVEFLRRVGI